MNPYRRVNLYKQASSATARVTRVTVHSYASLRLLVVARPSRLTGAETSLGSFLGSPRFGRWETQLCDLNAPVNRRIQKCRGPSHTRRRRRPRARTGVENLAPARGSGAARDTLEAQLKQRPKFKAPRPAGRHDPPAATRRPPRRAETPRRRRRRRRPLQLVGRRLAEGRRGSAARRSAAREVVLSRRAHGARGFLYPLGNKCLFLRLRRPRDAMRDHASVTQILGSSKSSVLEPP